jgi:tetratricopeptide (TPR) repeat protein
MKKIIVLVILLYSALASFCQNCEQHFKKGQELFDRKDYFGAIESYSKAIDLTLFESDEKSRKKYLEQTELKRQISNYFLRRGHAKFEIRDYIGAEKDFWNVTMILPDFSEGHFQKGKAYYALGIFELAKYSFYECIKIDSNDAEAYFRRGLSNYELGNFNLAIDDYTKALEIQCCPAEAYYERGRAIGRLGKFLKANEEQTKAIEVNPKYALAYQERALGKIELNDYAGAMQDFNISLSIESNARTYRSRGLLKMLLTDFRGCIADCSKSIDLDPYFPVAYMTRGMAKIQLKQIEEGCFDLSKAGELGMTDAYEEIKRSCKK